MYNPKPFNPERDQRGKYATQYRCHNCQNIHNLATTTTNRCPNCEWIVEIYYNKKEAEEVVAIYNQELNKSYAHRTEMFQKRTKAGMEPLIHTQGFSVSFPDQEILANVTGKILESDYQTESNQLNTQIFAQVFQIYIKESDAVQSVIREMCEVINDKETSDNDREAAYTTLTGALFP